MFRHVSCCLGFLVVLACLMGADSLTHTSSTPNPNGTPNVILGIGAYTVDPANTFDKIIYYATVGKQKTESAATQGVPKAGDWSCSLLVAPATYDTFCYMNTIENKTGKKITTGPINGSKGVVVK